jgi:hypothetical protein
MELREEFTIPVRNPGLPAWAPAPARPAFGLEAMPLYEETTVNIHAQPARADLPTSR